METLDCKCEELLSHIYHSVILSRCESTRRLNYLDETLKSNHTPEYHEGCKNYDRLRQIVYRDNVYRSEITNELDEDYKKNKAKETIKTIRKILKKSKIVEKIKDFVLK